MRSDHRISGQQYENIERKHHGYGKIRFPFIEVAGKIAEYKEHESHKKKGPQINKPIVS